MAAPPARADEAPRHVGRRTTSWSTSRLTRTPCGSCASAKTAETVCAPPCDKRVPRDGTYRIVGAGHAADRHVQRAERERPAHPGRRRPDRRCCTGSASEAPSWGSARCSLPASTPTWLQAWTTCWPTGGPTTLHDPVLWGSLLGALVFGVGGGLLIATSGTWVRTSNGVSFGHASARHSRAPPTRHADADRSDFLTEEEEGFEPPALSRYGFQDRRLRPLGHSSGLTIQGVTSVCELSVQPLRLPRGCHQLPVARAPPPGRARTAFAREFPSAQLSRDRNRSVRRWL